MQRSPKRLKELRLVLKHKKKQLNKSEFGVSWLRRTYFMYVIFHVCYIISCRVYTILRYWTGGSCSGQCGTFGDLVWFEILQT